MADEAVPEMPFDPLLAQAENLPGFLKGTGGQSSQHVQSVQGEGEEFEEDLPEDALDLPAQDGSSLTAD